MFHFVFLSNEQMGEKGLVAEVAPGVFVSKTKIVIIGVILLVLLILVIVLGALLGHTRSKLSGILLSCHLVDALVTIWISNNILDHFHYFVSL